MKAATLKIYPNRNKFRQKDKTTPLYLRIIKDGNKAEAKIPLKLNELEYNKWDYVMMQIEDPNSLINNNLMVYKTRFNQFMNRNFESLTNIDATEIRDWVIERLKKCDKHKVLVYVNRYYSEIVIPSTNWSNSTKKIFRKSINHFDNFLKHKKLADITFDKIIPNLGDDFFNYLTSNIHLDKINENDKFLWNKLNNQQLKDVLAKKGITKESASVIIKKIKTIFKRAVKENLLSQNPFDGIKIKIEYKKKEKLSIFSLRDLYIDNLSQNPSMDLCKDIFLLQTLTGLSYVDLLKLKRTDIRIDGLGNKKIELFRQKTKIEVFVFLNKFILNILNKYNDHIYVQINNTLIPKISLKEYNLKLKVIAEKYNIPIQGLSSHYGRHCFRQLLKEAKVHNPDAICLFMGWALKNRLDGIYSTIIEKDLIEEGIKFEKYLERYLEKN